MRDSLDRFGDTTVAVVTFAAPERLAAHRDHLQLPFPLLADPERELYRRFEVGRGRIARVYGWGTLSLYARLMGRGRRFRRPVEDTLQLGGDFVIGPDGRLAAGFWPDGPDSRTPIDTLVTAVHSTR